ncbi:hypothetical protein QBC42DRAFT_277835 [Cladorrhinum samala]|uniref:DUF1993 domain-containing protein n=1 Tax=Cladorrhinum samala TaxID=585594 RepID=A0AAV9HEK2_9PEZI|nr:hypothetical protein QBC42DRAFT_277835 [Cladorrhinum samala]
MASSITISLADLATSTPLKSLQALHNILSKASSHPDSASFPSARLYPDMLPLTYQIYMVCKFAKVVTSFENQKTWSSSDEWSNLTLPELIAQVEGTQQIVGAAQQQKEKIAGGPHAIGHGPDRPSFTYDGEGLVLNFCYPNMYFHLSIAYAILRIKGVEVGKWDYLEPFSGSYIDRPKDKQ